jgi:hypothetical protein
MGGTDNGNSPVRATGRSTLQTRTKVRMMTVWKQGMNDVVITYQVPRLCIGSLKNLPRSEAPVLTFCSHPTSPLPHSTVCCADKRSGDARATEWE